MGHDEGSATQREKDRDRRRQMEKAGGERKGRGNAWGTGADPSDRDFAYKQGDTEIRDIE